MSAKIAIVIGDYSNGWSNAMIVQGVGNFKQEDCEKARRFVMGTMNDHLQSLMDEIEDNETICPQPKDEPCCEAFEAWAKKHMDADTIYCAICGAFISEERRKKYRKEPVE